MFIKRPSTVLIMFLVFSFASSALVEAALPSRWDWREHGGVTPVKNQGSCGSCWAFSTVGTVESAIRIYGGSTANISEQHLVSCNREGMGCNGGWAAFQYYHTMTDQCGDIGTVNESCFPYQGVTGTCTNCCSRLHELLDWGYIAGYSVPSNTAMKNYIYNYGPIFAAVDTTNWNLLSYVGGEVQEEGRENVLGAVNHGIVIVGWDDDFYGSGKGCWIIKNSWGTSWQDGGYGYVKYGTGQIGYGAAWVDYNGGSAGLDCDAAIDLTAHVPYNGTTAGAMSRVDEYGCVPSWDESGPEVVHRITTTSDGNVTAALSNLNGVDLDVFILSACDAQNPDSCLVYDDNTASSYAPAGTYFVVVDGFMGASGSYTLTVFAGLDCANAVPLTPGVPYTGSMGAGFSAVDSYGCVTLDETVPEKVHRITTFSSAGDLTATLIGPVGLNVCILDSCDPSSCLAHASSGGTATLPNPHLGTYLVVVDGQNGATGSYTLTADAPVPPGNAMPWMDCLLD